MGEIICLDNKIEHARRQKQESARKRKLLAVRKVFQCTHCSLKCEKCGTQIPTEPGESRSHRGDLKIPYRFCDSCAEEYVEYIERLKGKGDPDCYWHNPEWMDLWHKWIDYQGTLDQYMKSKEFVQLIHELKHTQPGP